MPPIVNDKTLKVLLTEEQIAARIRELGATITRDFAGQDLTAVCVLKGSFPFFADLVRAIDLPLETDFLGLSSYGSATRTSGVVKITSDLTRPVGDKHVLVVEDIVDTGLTMNYLLENLWTRKPASVKVCSLLYKPANALVDVQIDYLGFTIEDRFVIGYGLDLDQKYRNLPYIGYLEA